MPCYNYGHYLSDCLESILGQKGEHDFEIILIDDASTDHTKEVLHHYQDARLKVITHPNNLGHVASIREGLAQARGSYIARIDPDDRYRPCFLRETLDKFEKFPKVGLVYGDVALIDENGQITKQRSGTTHSSDFHGNELVKLLEKNFICSAAVIARREAWLEVPPVPEGLAFHDWYFTLMMARRWDFYYVDQVLADYRVHSNNHHTRIVQNRTEEPSIFQLLNQIFSEEEKSGVLERQKQRSKNRIYSAQYLTLADKYFGFEMNADARRCYLQALRYRPINLLRPDLIRHFSATLIGRRFYEQAKALLKT